MITIREQALVRLIITNALGRVPQYLDCRYGAQEGVIVVDTQFNIFDGKKRYAVNIKDTSVEEIIP